MAMSYRALGALLSYPTEALQAVTGEIAATLARDNLVSGPRRAAIGAFLAELAGADIYDLQEGYFALFDRGRTLSLHLFEHIHGESRDRGQAMANLVALYRSHGLEMSSAELPDFLPLFLEFLSLLPEAEARALLAEPAGVLRALADRLADRDSGYASVMEAVAELAQAPATGVSVIPAEEPDDLAALDASWEEAPVRFGPEGWAQGCGAESMAARLQAMTRDAPAPAPRRGDRNLQGEVR